LNCHYDTCDYRHEIAKEYGDKLNCEGCDIPDLLRPLECEKREKLPDFAYLVLNVYLSVMSRVVQRNPALTELAIAQHRTHFTRVELQMLFRGMEYIESLVSERQETAKKDTINFGELP
jgi:hypothetical protein